MQFTDAWIAGRLGSTELAAITPAVVLISLLSIFGIEALTGITTHVSQADGRGNGKACGAIGWQGLYCGAAFGLLCLIYWPAAETAFRTLVQTHSETLIALEVSYFQISLLGMAPLMISVALGNFFIGLGKTTPVMVAALVGVFANVFLSYGLTFGYAGLPTLGFPGIAWGTVFATTLQALIMLGLFLVPSRMRLNFGTTKASFCKKRSWRLIRTGLPIGMHGSLDFLAWGVVLVWLIGFFGESHLAAHSIMSRCISLSFLPADGLAAAVLTLVGRAVGSRDYLLARRYTRAGFMLIAGWMTAMALIYLILGGYIIRLFTLDPEIIAISQKAILWVAAFQFFDAMNVTYINALTGAGDTVWPSAVNLTLSLLVLLGGGLAMVTFFPAAGSSGIWAVATFYIFCQGMIYFHRWRTRAWQNPRLLA